MEDTQSKSDGRNLPIQKVGIKNIQYPIRIITRAAKKQTTIGTFEMYVNLAHNQKGTHMSRFVEIINAHREDIDLDQIHLLTEEMKSRLDSNNAFLKIHFPYFIEKSAPITKTKSFMNYEVSVEAADTGPQIQMTFSVGVPVTTLCPCSKSISEYGAHNQRGLVTARVRFHDEEHDLPMDMEEIVQLIEKTSSCEVFALLKREDEKFVTERAYENPVFVEDLVREISLALTDEPRVSWFSVEVTNFESIHNHDAVAFIEIDKDTTLKRESQAEKTKLKTTFHES